MPIAPFANGVAKPISSKSPTATKLALRLSKILALLHHGDDIDNIEIRGSHCGMSVHPAALYAIADRLAQGSETWRPFDRSGWRTPFYPAAGRVVH